jgi:acyl-CoA dehydrogenase
MTTPVHEPDRIRGLFAEFGRGFRDTALAVDRGETAVEDLVRAMAPGLRRLGLPADYDDDPLTVDGRSVHIVRCSQAVVVQEELAWGDPALLLAMPWSSMSQYLVEAVFDEQERDEHYRRVASEGRWTFFAVTEPDHGSDAAAMESTLARTEEGLVLNGTKRYIGNGCRAAFGFVFCRREGSSGPLGIETVRVDTDAPGFEAVPLPTLGLRGAGLSELRFDGVKVDDRDVLGRRRTATQRGLVGAVRTFDVFRPGVGAMALGVARAAYDYVRAERPRMNSASEAEMERFRQRLHATRSLIAAAARTVDTGHFSGALSSAAKASAVRLAEELTGAALRLLGPGARFDHPMLDKFNRDAIGFEYMEGMTDIQRQNIARGFLTNQFWPDPLGLPR